MGRSGIVTLLAVLHELHVGITGAAGNVPSLELIHEAEVQPQLGSNTLLGRLPDLVGIGDEIIEDGNFQTTIAVVAVVAVLS